MCEEDTFDFILLCFIFKYHCYYYEYMGIVMPLLYICNASQVGPELEFPHE